MKPFFSIVVPTYNRSQLIIPTIESILGQTYTDWELIIVDDGSTDNTMAFLSEKYGKYENIRLISQKNAERGAARNNGLRNAKGEYVCFLDSDDRFKPNHLETLNEFIQQENHPDFICTKFYLHRNNKTYPGDIVKYKQGYYDYHLFLSGNPLACNICVRKGNPGLFPFEEDRSYAVKEDWLFLLQNLRNNKMFLIDRVTIEMEDHDNRSMRADNDKIISKTHHAYEWIKSKLDLPENEDKELHAHVMYLSAVHSYLDNNRGKTISYISQAIRLRGWQKKYITLLIKGIAGRTIIRTIFPTKH